MLYGSERSEEIKLRIAGRYFDSDSGVYCWYWSSEGDVLMDVAVFESFGDSFDGSSAVISATFLVFYRAGRAMRPSGALDC